MGTQKIEGELLAENVVGGREMSRGNVIRRWSMGRVVSGGDANHTLAVAPDDTSDIDGTVLLYSAPITGVRTVTLTTTGAVAGMVWRITREASATGASAVSVGGLKNLAVGQWCEVVFDGTAWKLLQFGSL